jgi:hypothetical protein
VVGAEDERHGVEQEDGRLGLVCHARECNRGQGTSGQGPGNGA